MTTRANLADVSQGVCRDFAAVLAKQPYEVEALLGMGMARLLSEDQKGAKDWFGKAVRAPPECSKAYLYRARIDLDDTCPVDHGEDNFPALRSARYMPGSTEKDLMKVLSLSKDAIELRLAAGMLALYRADFVQAVDLLGRHLKDNADDAQAHGWLGHALYHQVRLEEASKAMTRAVEIDARLAGVWNRRGLLNKDLGNSRQAMEDYERALRIDPAFYPAFINRGVTLADESKFDEAMEDFDRAIELAPKYVMIYRLRGKTLAKMGNAPGAIHEYDQALALDPGDPNSHAARGWVRLHLGDAGGIADFDRVVELRPRNSWAHLERARAFMSQDQIEPALKDIEAVLQLKPGHPAALNGRAICMLSRNPKEALVDIERALEVEPQNPLFLTTRARALCGIKDHAGALRDFDRALETDPACFQAYLFRGMTRREQGDLKGSLEDMDRATTLDARNGSAWLHRGHTLRKSEKLREALQSYDRAAGLLSKSAELHLHRAITRRDLGDFTGAEADFKIAIEISPPDWIGRSLSEEELKQTTAARGREKEFQECEEKYGRCCSLYSEKEYAKAAEGFAGIAEAFPKVRVGYLSAYNVARCRAKLGELEAALEWLDRAHASGYRDAHRMETDPALKPLRSDDRFRRILDSLREGK